MLLVMIINNVQGDVADISALELGALSLHLKQTQQTAHVRYPPWQVLKFASVVYAFRLNEA